MWSRPDVVGLFSINVVSFSSNVVLSDPLFSLNVVWRQRILSVRVAYVLSSLHLTLGLCLCGFQSGLSIDDVVPRYNSPPEGQVIRFVYEGHCLPTPLERAFARPTKVCRDR
jgi:hypothetical protein